jgi:drug/metabolite transporter (DMT)-like permease
MEWFLLAILAPIVWAMGNHIDAFLVKYFIKNNDVSETSGVGSLIIVSCLVGILILPIVLVFNPEVFSVERGARIILIMVGFLEGVSVLAYLYAVMDDDIASVTAWFNSIPIFNLVLGFLILGESITRTQFVGFLIIILGLIILSVKKTELGLFLKRRVVLLMLSASFAYGLMTILFKLGARVDSFWVSSFWQYVGLSLLGILFFVFIKPYRRSFIEIFSNKGLKFYSINVINEFLFITGTMISNYASLLAPVALVSLVGSFQPLIVILFSFLIALFRHRKKEQILTVKERVVQVVGILLTIAGLPFILF